MKKAKPCSNVGRQRSSFTSCFFRSASCSVRSPCGACVVMAVLVVVALRTSWADAFVNHLRPCGSPLASRIQFRCSSAVVVRRHNANYSRHHHRPEPDDLPDKSDGGSLNQEIQRRAEKMMLEKERQRLEDENLLKRLRSKPRKLPYEQARTWVQANLGVDTEAEFHDLVANGNLRTPYIPKNPQEYYTNTREWISWDHFLCGLFDGKKPSSIRPRTGFFD